MKLLFIVLVFSLKGGMALADECAIPSTAQEFIAKYDSDQNSIFTRNELLAIVADCREVIHRKHSALTYHAYNAFYPESPLFYVWYYLRGIQKDYFYVQSYLAVHTDCFGQLDETCFDQIKIDETDVTELIASLTSSYQRGYFTIEK